MKCIHIPNGVVCIADVADAFITVNRKRWHFEYDRRFGPTWMRRDGMPRSQQNVPKAVWDAFDTWLKNYDGENP